ncbi:GtrA family protein [Paenibacillus brasilensis]
MIFNNSFTRYLLVGVINTLIGLSAIYLLYNVFSLNYWISTSIGNAIGMISSFILNRRFTFKSDVSILKSSIKFIAVSVISYCIAYYLGYLLILIFEGANFTLNRTVYNNLSILLSSGLYTILGYVGNKRISFK